MDKQEALRVLGLDGTESERDAKRAYLRAVKANKPEQDPEGFARVREAYELIEGRMPLARGPESGPILEPEPSWLPIEIANMPSARTHCRDAAVELPTEPAVGVGQPLPLPFTQLVATQLQVGHPIDVRLLEQAVEHASGVDLPEASMLIEACFAVMRDGAVTVGQTLLASVVQRVRSTGSELALSRTAGDRLMLADELLRLPRDFDDELRSILARTALAPDEGRDQLFFYFGKAEWRADDIRERLHYGFPALATLAQVEPPPEKKVATPRFGWADGMPWFFILYVAFRLFTCMADNASKSDTNQVVREAIVAGEAVGEAESLCALSDKEACRLAKRALVRAASQQCEGAYEAMGQLEDHVIASELGAELSDAILDLRMGVTSRCEPSEPTGRRRGRR